MEHLPTIDQFCCQNNNCPDKFLYGKGNLTFRGWSGKSKKIRMIYCKTCKSHVSERKGTLLEKSKISADKVNLIMDYLRKGKGTRATSRLVKVHRDTVTRYSRIIKRQKQLDEAENLDFEAPTSAPSTFTADNSYNSVQYPN